MQNAGQRGWNAGQRGWKPDNGAGNMTKTWMAIEERVPGADGAVRRHLPESGVPVRRSRLVQSIIDAVAAEPRSPAWLVAPSRRVGRQWIDTIALGGVPVFNVRATTPRALCYDLAAPSLAAAGLSVASSRASLVLLEKVLLDADRGGRLQYFKSPRSYRRLADRMWASVSALRMAGITADAMRQRERVDARKRHDIAFLLEHYAAELATEKLADAADVASMALDTVRAGRVTGEWQRILVPDAIDLKRLERDVIAALGDRVTPLAIDAEPLSFSDPDHGPAIRFFRGIGAVNEVRGVLRRCLAEAIPLDTVELLHADPAAYPALVQEVLAVMAGSPAGDARTIAELPVTFAEGLPIRESRPARALASWLEWRADGHPQWLLVRMLRDGLLNWNRDWNRDERARDAGAAAPEPGIGSHEDDDSDTQGFAGGQESADGPITQAGLLRELRRLRIGFDLAHANDKVHAAIAAVQAAPLASFIGGGRDQEQEVEFDEDTAVRCRDRRIASLRVLAGVLARLTECEPPRAGTAIETVKRVRLFLEQLATARSQFDNNAKNRLLAEIADMERWLVKHPRADQHETLEWITGLVDSLVVMGTAPRPGCLHVASIATGGHSGRPHTFIVGLDEARFPGPGSSDPVLPDADRAAISDTLEVGAAAAARVRADFWRLLGRLRGDVRLSYNCRDLVQQAEMFPSPLLLEVYRRQSGALQATLHDFLAAIATETESFVPRDPRSALNDSEWWLATLGENPSIAAVGQAAAAHGDPLIRGLQAEEQRRSPMFTEWDGLVPAAGPELDPGTPAGREASAHSLEALGACPRRFFFRYGLEVKPLDSLEPESDRWLDDREHGDVLHQVLERFMRRFLHTGPGRPADSPHPTFAKHEAEILAVLDDVLAARRAEKPTTDEASVAACRREVAEALRTFLRVEERYCAETGSRPVAVEAAIGFVPKGEGTRFDRKEPVSLRIGENRTIRLRGFVDRIDVDGRDGVENGYAIIDYKKGRSTRFNKTGENPLAVFDKGRRLQHGLYVMMVRHVVGGTGGDAGHVTRFSYLFPGAAALGERLEWTAEQLAGVDALVDRLCGIVAAGAFLPTTVKDDCTYCDFSDVCGESVTQDARRKLLSDMTPRTEKGDTLKGLFKDIREVKSPPAAVPILRPNPQPFAGTEEPAPDGIADAAAREAIRTALTRSMLVEASAGTGKTTCMVDRMTALVRTGTATAGEIAAITFTKKAAAELARRFRERLETLSADAAVPDDERQRLQAALAEIDTVVIGTVHSFCGRLLKDRPIEAGLDPAVETLDEAAEQALRDRAWREFCDRVPGDAALEALRQPLAESGVDLRDLRSAYETIVAQGDVRDWPHEPVDPPDVKALLEDVCRRITAELAALAEQGDAEFAKDKLASRLEAVLRAWSNRHDDSPASLFRVAEKLEGECPDITQGLWLLKTKETGSLQQQRDRKKELEQRWDEMVAELAGPLAQWRAYRYQFVIPLLERARDHYEQVRLAEGKLSFHDLLMRTAQLLREWPAVRVTFARRYPHLLVDEFQDTDPLQAEILLLLTAADERATDWRTTTIKPGSLFVVGDPKQSIYRFRRADIDTFEFVKERITQSGGEVLHLTTNFRSSRELVSWINDRFAGRFSEHRDGKSRNYGPEFTASHVGRPTAVAGTLTGLRQLRVKTLKVEAEAEAVATFIRRAIDHRLKVPRASEGESADCRPDDFMIVTWDTGELSTYAEALNAVGLPCDVTGRKGNASRQDLAPLRLCLSVVADADDTVAALAVLRGPVFGFSDAELHAFRTAGGRIDGRLLVPEGMANRELATRLRSAAEAFRRWRRMAGSLPLAAALERIAADAGLLLVASAAGGLAGRRGRAAAGTIATFIERVRAERSLLTSVQDVVDRIDDLVRDDSPKRDFDTISIDAATGGAVRVMNLHKVKGLEAPVVFLCDQDGPHRDRTRGPSWHVARSETGTQGYLKIVRAGLFGNGDTTLATPQDWRAVEATELLYKEAEFLRLNYVAGTRPGACVVASVFEKDKGVVTGGWHALSPEITGIANLPDLEPHLAAEQARAAAAARPTADDAAVAAAREETLGRGAAVRTATFGTVTPRDFLTEPAERIRHTGRGLGQDWGTVIHRLLELSVQQLRERGSKPDLATVAANVVAESDLAESGIDRTMLAERAVTLVEEIQRSDVWRRLEAASQRHDEVPFSIAVLADEIPAGVEVDFGPGRTAAAAGPARGGAKQASGSPPVLIRGQIDAVYCETPPPPAGMTRWVIVDWKTTSIADSEAEKLVAHYRPQLRLYARCWAADLPQS